MILLHLEGIATIKKFGFKFILFFLIASPIIASETTISERPDFENLVKEKKLKAKKSEISENSKLVSSNTNNELEDINTVDFKKLESDTITRTKIVDNVSNNPDKHQLEEIFEELKNIRITLAKQDTILRDILLKLDENN